jgi:hypothetical protein
MHCMYNLEATPCFYSSKLNVHFAQWHLDNYMIYRTSCCGYNTFEDTQRLIPYNIIYRNRYNVSIYNLLINALTHLNIMETVVSSKTVKLQSINPNNVPYNFMHRVSETVLTIWFFVYLNALQ